MKGSSKIISPNRMSTGASTFLLSSRTQDLAALKEECSLTSYMTTAALAFR